MIKLPRLSKKTKNIIAMVMCLVFAVSVAAAGSTILTGIQAYGEDVYDAGMHPTVIVDPAYFPDVTVTPTEPAEPPVPQLDRTKPLYEVYKNGWHVTVPTEWQWFIRDMCEKYNFPEPLIYGMILTESCFNTYDRTSIYKGLCQIEDYWIRTTVIPRFDDNWRNRNLYDPYDNITTLFEMWCYARDKYGIDVWTTSGQKDILYWHNTGKYKKNVNWAYSDKCLRFASELVPLQ